jgi:Fic family protein
VYNPPFTITPKILNLVGEITEIITKLEMLSFNIDLKLRKISKIKTITGTLQIEGNTLTEEKVTAILEGKRVLGSLKEITEVKGAIALYENIDKFDYQNLDDLLKAHKILMQDLLKEAGVFRNSNVGVGNLNEIVHIAPPPKQIPKLMQNLFDWLKVDIHPLIKSSVFHYEFEFIHPFVDGNGRIGRFWQTLILYNWKKVFLNIPIESIVRDTQVEYYKTIEKSSEISDSYPFIEYMLESILTICKETLQNVPKKDLKNDPKKRVKKILELIKENKFITIKELADKLNVSEKTIKRDLDKLKKENILKRIGKKGGYWKIK